MFKRVFDNLDLILEDCLQIQQNVGFSRDIQCQHNFASVQTNNDDYRTARVKLIVNISISILPSKGVRMPT